MKTSSRFDVCFAGFLMLVAVTAAGCDQSSKSDALAGSRPAVEAAQPLPSDSQLKAELDNVIDFTRERHLSPQVNNAWQIVHGVLAYGNEMKLNNNGKLVPALDYILGGGQFKGWNLQPTAKGLESVMDPGTKVGEGHKDQWIGYISQCGAKLDHPIKVGNRTFAVRDLVTQAQWDVYDGMEATWTLMALSTYLPLDATWKAKDGSQWTIERLVGMEAAQNINESACGGSHRLYGLATALRHYRATGKPLTGAWLAAQEKIDQCIALAQQNQQPDGSFSTNYFQRASTNPDIALRLNTTGHTIEFLAMALDEKQLTQPWVTRAVVYLCNLLEGTKELPLECAGLYHATHGLRLYRERRFGPPPAIAEQAEAVSARAGVTTSPQ
ncbi:MAG TPA: ADP-ribosylation factor-directed GTPase activating protein isoform b [Pirellulales bacterium]|nr:ADP-ribosylation factor-directed GTPase activating protein isoform b [Pirellulales bacterium]